MEVDEELWSGANDGREARATTASSKRRRMGARSDNDVVLARLGRSSPPFDVGGLRRGFIVARAHDHGRAVVRDHWSAVAVTSTPLP